MPPPTFSRRVHKNFWGLPAKRGVRKETMKAKLSKKNANNTSSIWHLVFEKSNFLKISYSKQKLRQAHYTTCRLWLRGNNTDGTIVKPTSYSVVLLCNNYRDTDHCCSENAPQFHCHSHPHYIPTFDKVTLLYYPGSHLESERGIAENSRPEKVRAILHKMITWWWFFSPPIFMLHLLR